MQNIDGKEIKSDSVKCIRCLQLLPLTSFPDRKNGAGKVTSCVDCIEQQKKKVKERQSRSSEEIRAFQLKCNPSGLYECLNCHKEKPFVDFPINKGTEIGIKGKC